MESRAPAIEIRLLGPVELRIDGRDVPLGGPRQRALLALLALRAGQVLPADELVEELWAGEPTDGAETTLRSYVSRLRRSLDARASRRWRRKAWRLVLQQLLARLGRRHWPPAALCVARRPRRPHGTPA